MTEEAKEAPDYAAQLAAMQESIDKLSAKNQELLGEKKTAAANAAAAEEAKALAVEEAARKSGDVAALDKSWQEKFDAYQAETSATIKERDNQIGGLTSGAQSLQMAAELAVEGSSEVLNTLIKSRFKTEYTEGKPVTVILDKNGDRSAMTVAELKNELANDTALAPLISGSKASGSGGAGKKSSGGATSTGNNTLSGVVEGFDALPIR
tara:strand:- start:671 stop:1297 length:627 start_codon:yes stop_codon:yes gene_type:complete